MAEFNKYYVAEKVRHYLKDAHPGGATLEVLEDKIWPGEFAWRVGVQPDFEPKRRFEFHEALADAEIALMDEENLTVLLVPMMSKADVEEDRQEMAAREAVA